MPTPALSIVIPAYNAEDYIAQCLGSLTSQTCTDLEVVVVDDASTDGTAGVIEACASEDPRIRLIRHPENRGRHAARATGVEAAKGEYLLLMDNDDELLPTAAELLLAELEAHPVDSLHYGITVIPEGGLLEEEARAFEQGVNTDYPAVEDEAVMRSVFDEAWGFAQDWRVTQRVFRTELAQQAFAAMDVATRIDRGEDAYETFVILSMAKSAASLDGCRGYVYHYGRGTSGSNQITPADFRRACEQFRVAHEAIAAYVDEHPSALLRDCQNGVLSKNYELVGNEWKTRVPPEQGAEAAEAFADAFGLLEGAREAWRMVRDQAEWLLSRGGMRSNHGELQLRIVAAEHMDAVASQVEHADGNAWQRYRWMRDLAQRRVERLQAAQERREAAKDQTISIAIPANEEIAIPDSPVFRRVQPGATQAPICFTEAFGDNEDWPTSGGAASRSGEAPQLGWLSALWWHWHHAPEQAEYLGFMEPDAYLDFSAAKGLSIHSSTWDAVITPEVERRRGLDAASITARLQGVDIAVTRPRIIVPTRDKELYDWLRHDWGPYSDDPLLREAGDSVVALYPEYGKSVDACLAGEHAISPRATYVMRRPAFDAWCTWLFSIIDRFRAHHDESRLAGPVLQISQRLQPFLLGVYVHHQLAQKSSGWRVKRLPGVLLRDWYPVWPLEEPEPRLGDCEVVPVVCQAEHTQLPSLAAGLITLSQAASGNLRYEATILTQDISAYDKQLLEVALAACHNLTLRYADPAKVLRSALLERGQQPDGGPAMAGTLAQEALPYWPQETWLGGGLLSPGELCQRAGTPEGSSAWWATVRQTPLFERIFLDGLDVLPCEDGDCR